jgi:hypothetical protein
LETDDAGAPRLVFWRTAEGPELGVECIDICYNETKMIDSRWITEQAELTPNGWQVTLSRGKKMRVTRRHHHPALVPVRFRETQFLIKRDRPYNVGRADSDVVDALYHLLPPMLVALTATSPEKYYDCSERN